MLRIAITIVSAIIVVAVTANHGATSSYAVAVGNAVAANNVLVQIAFLTALPVLVFLFLGFIH